MIMTDDVCGIYLITNKNTGQMYVGQSIDIHRRFRDHRCAKGLGHSRIDNAINKYGAENFSFEIIMTIENDTKQLNDAEREWISILNTYEDDFHYNLTPGGDFNPSKVPEIAAKISKANSGKNHPMYGKRGKECPRFGCKHTPETKAKISKAISGENNPMKNPEVRAKISGENNPMKNPETAAKVSEARKGIEFSEEHRRKLSASHTGKKHSEKTKQKMSHTKNTTGYYRVYRKKYPKYKQGFIFRYQYWGDDGKQHAITSVDINKLEQKVRAKGLTWLKFKEE